MLANSPTADGDRTAPLSTFRPHSAQRSDRRKKLPLHGPTHGPVRKPSFFSVPGLTDAAPTPTALPTAPSPGFTRQICTVRLLLNLQVATQGIEHNDCPVKACDIGLGEQVWDLTKVEWDKHCLTVLEVESDMASLLAQASGALSASCCRYAFLSFMAEMVELSYALAAK